MTWILVQFLLPRLLFPAPPLCRSLLSDPPPAPLKDSPPHLRRFSTKQIKYHLSQSHFRTSTQVCSLTCCVCVTLLFFCSFLCGLDFSFRQEPHLIQQAFLFPLLPLFQNDLHLDRDTITFFKNVFHLRDGTVYEKI